MFKTYFSSEQITLILTGGLFIIISLYLFHLKKYNWSILSLFIGALFIHFFAAQLDPFLNLWDERFHALVAKNMMNNPFVPKLYPEKAIDWHYTYWNNNYVWLHKQPLFLWQMALSMKIFGVNEFGVRFPSVIMSSLLVLFAFRTGKLLVDEKLGYYAAFITATSHFIIKLVSGNEGMDHNDLAFTFYVSAGIWAYTEFYFSKKKYWIILIGIFAGCAVLNKWLVGLLVFAGWGINILFDGEKFSFRKFSDLLLSLLICIVIFLPWQIYILSNFHALAMTEYRFNSAHIFKALEGHDGGFWYHLDNMKELFGHLSIFFILPGFILLFKYAKQKRFMIGFTVMPVLIYLLFSLAKTKVDSHPFGVSLIVFLSLGICIKEFVLFFEKSFRQKVLSSLMIALLLIALGIGSINPEVLQARHTLWKEENVYSRALIKNKEVFQYLNNSLPEGTVVFNVHGIHSVDLMFHTDFNGYNFMPTEDQYKQLKLNERPIAVFINWVELPEYIKNDPTVILIEAEMGGYM